MNIRFLGHSAFELSTDMASILIDPFITGNPKGVAQADEFEPDAILVTHGHHDHLGDARNIASRTGAPVLAIVEIADELSADGVNVIGANLGGTVSFDWGWVRLVPAWHTSTTPKGTVNTPAGLVVSMGERIVYHLGDTALFSDLALVAARDKIDVALMCIGGHYTMDARDAVAAAELLQPETIVPCHYNTFPPIAADALAFKSAVESETSYFSSAEKVVVLDPGESLTI